MAKKKENGVWRTIGGRRIFIEDGKDLASAMKESGKFGSKKDNGKVDEVEEVKKQKVGSDEKTKWAKDYQENRDDYKETKKDRDIDDENFNLDGGKSENTKDNEDSFRDMTPEKAKANLENAQKESAKAQQEWDNHINKINEKLKSDKGNSIDDDTISYIASTTNSTNDSSAYAFNKMIEEAKRNGLKVKRMDVGANGKNSAFIDFSDGSKVDFYDLKNGKAKISNADTDTFNKIEKALNSYRVHSKEDVSYDFNNKKWINNNENTSINGLDNSKYDKKWKEYQKKSIEENKPAGAKFSEMLNKSGVKGIGENYFGKEKFEKYGKAIEDNYRGKEISKSIADADKENGLRSIAKKIGARDEYDVVEALEGMARNGKATEVRDGVYKINHDRDYNDGKEIHDTFRKMDAREMDHFSKQNPDAIEKMRRYLKKQHAETDLDRTKELYKNTPTQEKYDEYKKAKKNYDTEFNSKSGFKQDKKKNILDGIKGLSTNKDIMDRFNEVREKIKDNVDKTNDTVKDAIKSSGNIDEAQQASKKLYNEDKIYMKAYREYMQEHPDSNITYEKFKRNLKSY